MSFCLFVCFLFFFIWLFLFVSLFVCACVGWVCVCGVCVCMGVWGGVHVCMVLICYCHFHHPFKDQPIKTNVIFHSLNNFIRTSSEEITCKRYVCQVQNFTYAWTEQKVSLEKHKLPIGTYCQIYLPTISHLRGNGTQRPYFLRCYAFSQKALKEWSLDQL